MRGMRKAIPALLFLSFFTANSSGTNDYGSHEISVPCNLTEGTCSRELELAPITGTDPVDWTIQLVPPESFHGMLEWRVAVWNGRKWEAESVFAYAPFCKDRTAVKVNRKTLVRVRVSVFPASAPRPSADVAIVAYTD